MKPCVAIGLVIVAVAMEHSAVVAASEAPPKRAKPLQWSADVVDTFFPDARDKLVGERPDFNPMAAPSVVASNSLDGASAGDSASEAGFVWSKLIDAETIEAEIKRIGAAVAVDVSTPGEFKGGGYKQARRHFSLLAVLFGVASEYDGEVRWQDAAAALRDQFARAGQNAKVGTDQTYREALERKQDLAELVRGSRPQLPRAEEVSDWSLVAGRAPLMQRLNMAQQERLTKWLASEREFERNREEVHHEAQLMAMLADVISREGFEYWDDETYAGYAHELRAAANDISGAAETENYAQARQALDRATKACADCHDGYRG